MPSRCPEPRTAATRDPLGCRLPPRLVIEVAVSLTTQPRRLTVTPLTPRIPTRRQLEVRSEHRQRKLLLAFATPLQTGLRINKLAHEKVPRVQFAGWRAEKCSLQCPPLRCCTIDTAAGDSRGTRHHHGWWG